MKKKIGVLLITGVLAMSSLVACGDAQSSSSSNSGSSNTSSTTTTSKCSDESFKTLQESYAKLVEAYNSTKSLYESGKIAQSADVTSALNQSADVINQMGTITQDTITEADAESLMNSMVTLVETFTKIIG